MVEVAGTFGEEAPANVFDTRCVRETGHGVLSVTGAVDPQSASVPIANGAGTKITVFVLFTFIPRSILRPNSADQDNMKSEEDLKLHVLLLPMCLRQRDCLE